MKLLGHMLSKSTQEEHKGYAVIYARVSTKHQLKDNKHSLEAQESAASRYIDYKEYKLIDTFRDAAVSGTAEHKPNLERAIKALEDCPDDKIKVLVFYKIDRLSRSVLLFSNLVDRCNRSGITLYSTSDSLDFSSPTGRLMVNILASFAEFERDQTCAKISHTMHEMIHVKRKWIGKLPFGYDLDKPTCKLVRNDDYRKVEEILNSESSIKDLSVSLGLTYNRVWKIINQRKEKYLEYYPQFEKPTD